MDKVIEVKDIIKQYSTIKVKKKSLLSSKELTNVNAINNINFNVRKGEKVGYVGLNGAGKSTTIKMLTGLVAPTSGKLNILGFEPFVERRKYVQHIGVVFGQRNQLFWDLKVRDSFVFNKDLYRISEKQYQETLTLFNKFLDLESLMDRRVLTLSLGQRMRANVVLSLLHSPDILFLDEPTIGVDILVKDEIINLLNEINQRKETTIMFTSHDMKDIEHICDRIIVLEKGKILEDLSISEFNKRYGGTKRLSLNYSESTNSNDICGLFENEFKSRLLKFSVDEKKKEVILSFKDSSISLVKVLKVFEDIGLDPSNATINSDNLEDSIRNIYSIKMNDL